MITPVVITPVRFPRVSGDRPYGASMAGVDAQLADALRKAVEPGAFEQDKRDWWVTQASIECNNLFNDPALEPFLMVNAPKAYGVIRLSAISKPDGTKL